MAFFLQYKFDVALLLMRIVLGVLFFFQGYDKIFKLGLHRTEEGVVDALHQTKLPTPFVKFIVGISSFIELIGGLLLILGLFIYPAIFLLGFDLAVVVIAMSLKEPLWDMRFVWPRLLLLLALLLLPATFDRISLDHLFHFYENSPLLANG